MNVRTGLIILSASVLTLWPARLVGQGALDDPIPLAQVVVTDRSTDLIGSAVSASQGSVGSVQLESRPFLRRGELLEAVPGVVITQHSGGGKANQYFLRGFNLDHGTDFSISADGMPVNLRSHAHGQGYADVNFLIPELVQEISYEKGPFFAEVGDFSAAGAAQFHLFKELPRAVATVTVGDNQFTRFVVADSLKGSLGVTTYGFEAGYDNGAWDLKENFKRFSGMIRQAWTNGDQEFEVTALAYHAKWRSSDQVPLRAVTSGMIDRFGNIDPSDQGETDRESLSFDWKLEHSDSRTQVNLYVIAYKLSLYSDFTYFLDDPINGDQFNQQDRRSVLGGSVEHVWFGSGVGGKSETKVGLQMRDDIIPEVAIYHTSDAKRIGTIRDDRVNEGSAGVYASNETHWTNWLRTQIGGRADAYRFNVVSDLPQNSGNRTAAIFSPKLGMILGPWEKMEFYFNAGMGFHSNDARGTTIRIDPQTGAPAQPVSPLVRSKGLEAGVRTSAFKGLVSTVSIWMLDLDSELVFTGDSGGTEASGATRRYGVEFANFYRVSSWLSLDADASFTNARYRHDVEGGGRRVANSIGTVFTGGVVLGAPSGWFGSLRARYFGPQPILEDNSVREPSSLTLDARLGYRRRNWEVSLDVLNLLDRKTDDIAYYYTSRLRGEPVDGIDDIHFHPAEPREVRMNLTKRF